ncbi:MAG TPA: pyridoxal phosphate-dependent aminotransferase, partial [Pseudomonadota bacterium]|nr:pyridoxal phosphate-dependent aminotransferase [Pseudomonadota bacterium]
MSVHFSSRLPWERPPNRFATLLATLRQKGVPLLDLTVSNPTRALPSLYPESLLAPLSSPRALRYEPSPQGADSAREAIAHYYQERGFAVDPDHIVLCASTSEAYAWLFQLFGNAGDAVLFPEPSYPLLPLLGQLTQVEVVPYPLRFDGRFHLSLPDLAAQITPASRAVVCVSPNNPTGNYLRESEAAGLLRLCAAHELPLIVDEVFSDYPFADPHPQEGPRLLSLAALPPELAEIPTLRFVLSGFSKVLGLPQLKLGWIVVCGKEPLRTQAQDRLELIADTFLSVGTPIQLAASELLAQRSVLATGIAARTADSLQLLQQTLAGSMVSVLPVEGGWYAVLKVPQLIPEE